MEFEEGASVEYGEKGTYFLQSKFRRKCMIQEKAVLFTQKGASSFLTEKMS